MKRKPIHDFTVTELLELVRKDEFSVEGICQSYLERIAEKDPSVRAWENLDHNIVLENARRLDQKRQKVPLGVLGGIPVGVKDVFNTFDYTTEMGSSIWKGFNAGNDARVVHYIRQADALILGKTVTAEFAVHYLPANKTTNPHHYDFIPGTSSSGSAAAVASKMAPLAVGTQTAGSIIRPASYCGVYGFKPTFGTVARVGVLKTSDTLDTVGCFANSIDDITLLFNVIRAKGRDYPVAFERLKPSFRLSFERRLKIGYIVDGVWVFENFTAYAQDAVLSFISMLEEKNLFELVKVNPSKEMNEIHNIHSTIYDKGLAYYFKNEFKDYRSSLSDLILNSIQNGDRITTGQYQEALKKQVKVREDVHRKLDEFDIVLCLSTAGEPPLTGVAETPDLCLIWTFLGNPSISVPLFSGPNQMPFGLQLISSKYDDFKLLEFAKYVSQNFMSRN